MVRSLINQDAIDNNRISILHKSKILSSFAVPNQEIIIEDYSKITTYGADEKNFANLNSFKARYLLEFLNKDLSAKNINYIKQIIFFLIIFTYLLIWAPNIFHIINNFCYFIQNLLKAILFTRASFFLKAYERNSITAHFIIRKNKYLPTYTVLVPLYKEVGKLKSILQNIASLNYPRDKLDVKIIIEEDDYLMIKEISLYDLPFYMQIIYVPFSLPRTKPKALNYALQYSKGEYIVVYDAEDKPDKNQLMKALEEFQVLPHDYVCLQAKLSFYNKDENLLTKMFNIEYSLWFEYILKGLSLLNLPVTLGGTSNHFKADILRKIGAWDAYNVTEDADLGIRIYANGYKVKILDSYTEEEAPITLGNWINQRSRWIKGFLQTFFVFLGKKNKYKSFNFKQITTIYIFIGFSSYSFWLLPILLFGITINKNSLINYLWLANSFFAFSYLYVSAFYILKSNKLKLSNFFLITLWPFYFILHTIASYKAFFEIIFNPFKWNKTEHGMSTKNFE